MKNFNADDYEPVDARIRRFYADHPEGSILTHLISDPNNMDYAVFKAEVHTNGNLRATGWSQAIRDKELTKSKKGFEYESVNYTSWLENAETSAAGRALANFNYQGSKRASREEMQKADNRLQAGEEEAPRLYSELDGLLTEALGVLDGARIKQLREAMGSHKESANWLRQAMERVRKAMAEQEALLAANTTPNPAEAAVARLQAAAQQAGKIPPATVKQEEIF